MLNPEDPLVRTAVFGKEVERFLHSDVGSYLLQRAKEQSDSNVEKLKTTPPTHWEAIMVLQMKINEADHIIDWLGDAIRAGLQATEQLKEDL
jgi:CII-binding regulator of phage lambda lysogenization HflD